MRKFGKILKDLRIEKGLSMSKLSKEIGFSTTSICRWENDQADINGDALIAFSKFYNVSTDYILGLED